MKKAILFFLIALVVFSGIYIVYKRELDQFNPFYKQVKVYAVVDQPAEPETTNNNTRYRYNLKGYTVQGQANKITFSSSIELEQGTYVQVLAKGAYTKEWMKLKKQDMPTPVLEKMGEPSDD